MTKLSSESMSILESARRDYAPTADARRRIRERVLERATAPESSDAPSGVDAAKGVRSRLSSIKTLGLVGACAFLVVGFVAVRVATVAPKGPANDSASPPSPALVAESKHDVSPANDAPSSEPTISPYLLPDAPVPNAKNDTGVKGSSSALVRKAAPEPATAAESSPGAAPSDSLGAEMRILREAHAALKSGDTTQARTLLDEHARTYPRGVLREERLALMALVLCSQGRPADARRAADELAHANPRSSHLERLRGSCVADATFPRPQD